MPETLPDGLEAGTPNTVGFAGLTAACRFVRSRGVATLHRQALALASSAIEGLRGVPGLRLFGLGPGERLATFSFVLDSWDLGELALWLDREASLLLRAGLHCAPLAHRHLGSFPGGTLRASFGPFQTQADADRLVLALRRAAELAPSRGPCPTTGSPRTQLTSGPDLD
jgi:selenocysteine lyase/cysteine desulfurase